MPCKSLDAWGKINTHFTLFQLLESLESVHYYFALFTNNYYYIKVHYKENKNISKINYRSSEKKMCAVTKVA